MEEKIAIPVEYIDILYSHGLGKIEPAVKNPALDFDHLVALAILTHRAIKKCEHYNETNDQKYVLLLAAYAWIMSSLFSVGTTRIPNKYRKKAELLLGRKESTRRKTRLTGSAATYLGTRSDTGNRNVVRDKFGRRKKRQKHEPFDAG